MVMAQGPGLANSSKHNKVLKEKIVRKEKIILLLKDLLQVKNKTTCENFSQELFTLRSKSLEATTQLKRELFAACSNTKQIVQQLDSNRKTIEELKSIDNEKCGTIAHLEFSSKQLVLVRQQHEQTIESLKETIKTLEKKLDPNCFSKPKRKKLKDKSIGDSPPSPPSSVFSFPGTSKASPPPGLFTDGILTPASSISSTVPVADDPCSPGIRWLDPDSRSNSPTGSLTEVSDITLDCVPPLLAPIQSAVKDPPRNEQSLPLLLEDEQLAITVPKRKTVVDLENLLKPGCSNSDSISPSGKLLIPSNDVVNHLMKMDSRGSYPKPRSTPAISIFDLPVDVSDYEDKKCSSKLEKENQMWENLPEESHKQQASEKSILCDGLNLSDSSELDMVLDRNWPDEALASEINERDRIGSSTDDVLMRRGLGKSELAECENVSKLSVPDVNECVRSNLSVNSKPIEISVNFECVMQGSEVDFSNPNDEYSVCSIKKLTSNELNTTTDELNEVVTNTTTLQANMTSNTTCDIDHCTKGDVESVDACVRSYLPYDAKSPTDIPVNVESVTGGSKGDFADLNDISKVLLTKKLTRSDELNGVISNPTSSQANVVTNISCDIDHCINGYDESREDCVRSNLSYDAKPRIEIPVNIESMISGSEGDFAKLSDVSKVLLSENLTASDERITASGELNDAISNPTTLQANVVTNTTSDIDHCTKEGDESIDHSSNQQTSMIEFEFLPRSISPSSDAFFGFSSDDLSPVKGRVQEVTVSPNVKPSSSPGSENRSPKRKTKRERKASTRSKTGSNFENKIGSSSLKTSVVEDSTSSLRQTRSMSTTLKQTAPWKTRKDVKELSPKVCTRRTRQNSTGETDLPAPGVRRSSRLNSSKSSNIGLSPKKITQASKNRVAPVVNSISSSTEDLSDSTVISAQSAKMEPKRNSSPFRVAKRSSDSLRSTGKQPENGRSRCSPESTTIKMDAVGMLSLAKSDHIQNIDGVNTIPQRDVPQSLNSNVERILKLQNDPTIDSWRGQSSETANMKDVIDSAQILVPQTLVPSLPALSGRNNILCSSSSNLQCSSSTFSKSLGSGSTLFGGHNLPSFSDFKPNNDCVDQYSTAGANFNTRGASYLDSYLRNGDDRPIFGTPKSYLHNLRIDQLCLSLNLLSMNPLLDNKNDNFFTKFKKENVSVVEEYSPSFFATCMQSATITDSQNSVGCPNPSNFMKHRDNVPDNESVGPNSEVTIEIKQEDSTPFSLKLSVPAGKPLEPVLGSLCHMVRDVRFTGAYDRGSNSDFGRANPSTNNFQISPDNQPMTGAFQKPSEPCRPFYSRSNLSHSNDNVPMIGSFHKPRQPCRPFYSTSNLSQSNDRRTSNSNHNFKMENKAMPTCKWANEVIKQPILSPVVSPHLMGNSIFSSSLGMKPKSNESQRSNVTLKASRLGRDVAIVRGDLNKDVSSLLVNEVPLPSPSNNSDSVASFEPLRPEPRHPTFVSDQIIIVTPTRQNGVGSSSNHDNSSVHTESNPNSVDIGPSDSTYNSKTKPVNRCAVTLHPSPNSQIASNLTIELEKNSLMDKIENPQADEYHISGLHHAQTNHLGTSRPQTSPLKQHQAESNKTSDKHSKAQPWPLVSFVPSEKVDDLPSPLSPQKDEYYISQLHNGQTNDFGTSRTQTNSSKQEEAESNEMSNENSEVQPWSLVSFVPSEKVGDLPPSMSPQKDDCHISELHHEQANDPGTSRTQTESSKQQEAESNELSKKNLEAQPWSIVSFVPSEKVDDLPPSLSTNLSTTSSSSESHDSPVVAKKRRLMQSPQKERSKSGKQKSIPLTEDQKSEVLRRKSSHKPTAVDSPKKRDLGHMNPSATSRIIRSSPDKKENPTAVQPKKKKTKANMISSRNFSSEQTIDAINQSINQPLKRATSQIKAGSQETTEDQMKCCSQCHMRTSICLCEEERIVMEMNFCPEVLSPLPRSPEPMFFSDDEVSDSEELENIIPQSLNEITGPIDGPHDDRTVAVPTSLEITTDIQSKDTECKTEIHIKSEVAEGKIGNTGSLMNYTISPLVEEISEPLGGFTTENMFCALKDTKGCDNEVSFEITELGVHENGMKDISEPRNRPVDGSKSVENNSSLEDTTCISTKESRDKKEVNFGRRRSGRVKKIATLGCSNIYHGENRARSSVKSENSFEDESSKVPFESSQSVAEYKSQAGSKNKVTSESNSSSIKSEENNVTRSLRNSTSTSKLRSVLILDSALPIITRSRGRPRKKSSETSEAGSEQIQRLILDDSSEDTEQVASSRSPIHTPNPEDVVGLDEVLEVDNQDNSSAIRLNEFSMKFEKPSLDSSHVKLLENIVPGSQLYQGLATPLHLSYQPQPSTEIEKPSLNNSVDKLLESMVPEPGSQLTQGPPVPTDLSCKSQQVGGIRPIDPLPHLGKFFGSNKASNEFKVPKVEAFGGPEMDVELGGLPSGSEDDSDSEMVVDYSSCSETETIATNAPPVNKEMLCNTVSDQDPGPSLTLPAARSKVSSVHLDFNLRYQNVLPTFYSAVNHGNNCHRTLEQSDLPSDGTISSHPPPVLETSSQFQFPKFYTAVDEESHASLPKEAESKKLIKISAENKIFCKLISEDDVITCTINVLAFASFYDLQEEPQTKKAPVKTNYQKFQVRIENTLKEYFGNTQYELKKATAALKKMAPSHVGKALCTVVGPKSPDILPYQRVGIAHHFTAVQKKAAVLVAALANGRLDYFNDFLSEIEEHLVPSPLLSNTFPDVLSCATSYVFGWYLMDFFPIVDHGFRNAIHRTYIEVHPDDTSKLNVTVNLSSIYALICRTQGFGLRAQAFIYDLLYGRHLSAFRIINQIVAVIPQVLPRAQDVMGPLTYTIAYLIMKQGIYQTLPPQYLAQSGVNILRQRLSSKYGYSFPADITRDTVMEELMSNVMVKGCDKAIVLLSKSQGYKWTFSVVQKHIFPLLDSWIDGQEADEDFVVHIIKLLGLVSRCFAITVCESFVSASLKTLSRIIERNPSLPVTGSVIEALAHFKRLSPDGVIKILANWIPHDGKVTKSMLKTMNTIIGNKSYSHWKQFVT